MNIFQHFFSTFILLVMVCSVSAQETEEEKKVFINNEATINSDKLEYSPAFYEDGIVFISTKVSNKRFKMKDKRIDKNVMSIFRSQREENGLLLPPKPFSINLLSTVHEGPLTFDRTGETIYFTRNTTKDGRKIKAKDGITKMSIYQAENVAGKWINITSLPFNNKEYNTVHPSISVEGDVLYFASNREGGAGGMDIWSVKKVGDEWSEPRNLGPSVNTESDEIFPFVHADGTLYFASNGHIGFGGLDLFFSRPGVEWSTATNLGAPFNSENDDFGFIIDRDKKNGYFSSSRSGGYGADDIYSFYVSGNLDELFDEDNRPKVVRDFTLMVSDNISSEMIEGATITYTNLDNLSITKAISGGSDPELQVPEDENTNLLLRVPMEELGMTGATDFLGKFPVSLSTGNYAFVIEKPGYQSRQILLDTENSQEEIFVSLDKEIVMANNGTNGTNGTPGSNNPDETNGTSGTNGSGSTSTTSNGNPSNNSSSNGGFSNTIREGSVFQLPNIYYNFNDASIRPDAKVDLDALAGFLSQYPDVEIELSSHTDSRGGSRYNKRLSQKRAENAVAYLIREGLPANRLVAVGYGEDAIRNHCTNGKECTEDEHQYNRRTEVKILRMNNEINIQFVNDTSPPEYVDKADFATNNSGSSASSTESYGGNSGDYTVIAGVYANYENAQKKQGKLQGMGYAQTSIKTVGNYYHIVVNTFTDRGQALSLQTNLTGDQINSFLKE